MLPCEPLGVHPTNVLDSEDDGAKNRNEGTKKKKTTVQKKERRTFAKTVLFHKTALLSKKPLTRVSKPLKRVPGGPRKEEPGEGLSEKVGKGLAKGVGEGLAQGWRRVGGFPCTLQLFISRNAHSLVFCIAGLCKTGGPNKVMAHMWFMHDAYLGRAFLFLSSVAEYTLLSMTDIVTPCLWCVVGMKLE